MTDRFDSAAVAGQDTCPTLIVRAERDVMIRAPRTARLLEAFGDLAQEVVVTGAGHNDVQHEPSSGDVLRAFLH